MCAVPRGLVNFRTNHQFSTLFRTSYCSVTLGYNRLGRSVALPQLVRDVRTLLHAFIVPEYMPRFSSTANPQRTSPPGGTRIS